MGVIPLAISSAMRSNAGAPACHGKRNMLAACHSRERLASRREACGKERSTIVRVLRLRKLVTNLLFRRAAKCNAVLYSAVKERIKSTVSYSFQKMEHFLKF